MLESIIHETCRRVGNPGQLETPIAQALTKCGAEIRGKVRIRKVCQGVMNAVITVLFRVQKGLKRVAISLNVLLREQPLRA